MRLDKFLQVSGLIKRRVLGNEACDRGLVNVNGVRAKPTREVKSGDVIDLHLPFREVSVRVLQELTSGTMRKSDRPKYLETLRDEPRKPTQDESWWEDDPVDQH
ncbi:MAG TPA: RNA-binding S4 domain-containing protein [Candidatus Ozemobacteraceae bacterium]|nr:RNA-binding S4 domain-containing protein [Candidatus Ozemobacteraceae bacterium]